MNPDIASFFGSEPVDKKPRTSKRSSHSIPTSPQNQKYTIKELAENEWLSFAMYTVESRAIPHLIDGLKPSQRFYLYSSAVNSPKNYQKVSAVAGVLSACVTGDTMITLSDGTQKSIEELYESDDRNPSVLSFDIDTQRTENRIASDIRITNNVSETIEIFLEDGSSIECTPGHRFAVRNSDGGVIYKRADELTEYDDVITVNIKLHDVDRKKKIAKIVTKKHETPIPVYDMGVDKNENFYANGILVHNCGYNHGEGSAAGAGQLMAAEWANNVCLIEGRGGFGSRLIQVPAAPRYTYTRLHANFGKYIKDIDLSPVHPDPEHSPPAFYLPVIPLVLVNGVKGIATGFATSILPRNPAHLITACTEYVKKGKIVTRPELKFPDFRGKTIRGEDGRYTMTGEFTRNGMTGLEITEVPYGYDRETYVEILDDLEEKGLITSYEDTCDAKGFGFKVKLKRGVSADWTDERILKEFKLVKVMSDNLTVVGVNGKIAEYSDELDLIRDFCDYRLTVMEARIAHALKIEGEERRWLKVKAAFIAAVLEEKIEFKRNTGDQVKTQIRNCGEIGATEPDLDRLLRISISSLTQDAIDELEKEIAVLSKSIDNWESTTPAAQFLSDLGTLK